MGGENIQLSELLFTGDLNFLAFVWNVAIHRDHPTKPVTRCQSPTPMKRGTAQKNKISLS